MKKCSECGTGMWEFTAKTLEDVEYKYYHCSRCGEETIDMNQLHAVAKKYRIGVNQNDKSRPV